MIELNKQILSRLYFKYPTNNLCRKLISFTVKKVLDFIMEIGVHQNKILY